MSEIGTRLQDLQARIRRCALDCGRDPDAVNLLAVSKTQPPEAIRAAQAAGQQAFGENYAQELAEKAQALAELEIAWHYIGPIQSNKTGLIARHAHWVHGIDRLSIAERLSRQRPDGMAPIQACLQVNISAEASKSGVAPEDLPALAEAVSTLPGLRLRGLMTLPAPSTDPAAQHRPFARLRELLEALQARGLAVDTLSMGMSGDWEAAIAEGATWVRIGTAIFGARRPRDVAAPRAQPLD